MLTKGGNIVVKIFTLLDDKGSEHLQLCAKHGLSYFIQTSSFNILFDCGSDGTAIENAKRMDVPFLTADCVVCSHSHYDHSGGFPDFIQAGVKPVLYTGKEFFEPKYAYDGVKYTYLGAGFDEEYLATKQICHKECRDFLKLYDNCYLFGAFDRTHACETIPKRFVKGNPPVCRPDNFEDEVCLVLSTSHGLVVVVGCSHPGILNMLTVVSNKLHEPIYAVLGGTHLMEANNERIQYTIDEMRKMGLKIIGLSHCSGDAAQSLVQSGDKVQGCHLAVGDCFAVD
jgi:7,8-dihydropterin-6-yl-methyl-4-(beta-D-ribofuranosyl)aminobenzene 5'-phosphate synthase